MTYGEIKLETLKMMFLNAQDWINEDWLTAYEDDETYRSYLANMQGSINRCFSSIEEKRILPSRQKTLSVSMGKAEGSFIRFDLSELIEDYFDLERVIRESYEGDYEADCDYRREGDVLVLPCCWKESKGEKLPCFDLGSNIFYHVVYTPKIKRVSSKTKDTDNIDLPENICAYVPYYLKGELFRDDEPNEAADAINQFEQRMNEIAQRGISKATSVKSIYSQTGW